MLRPGETIGAGTHSNSASNHNSFVNEKIFKSSNYSFSCFPNPQGLTDSGARAPQKKPKILNMEATDSCEETTLLIERRKMKEVTLFI